MRPVRVKPLEESADVRSRRAYGVIGLEVHAFVLHAAPLTFDEDIAPPGAAPVHGELAAAVEHGLGELFGGELAALIGVDDLGHTKARKGLLDNLLGVARLHGDGHLVCQHHAAGHIHHGGEVDNPRATGMYVVSSAQT